MEVWIQYSCVFYFSVSPISIKFNMSKMYAILYFITVLFITCACKIHRRIIRNNFITDTWSLLKSTLLQWWVICCCLSGVFHFFIMALNFLFMDDCIFPFDLKRFHLVCYFIFIFCNSTWKLEFLLKIDGLPWFSRKNWHYVHKYSAWRWNPQQSNERWTSRALEYNQ